MKLTIRRFATAFRTHWYGTVVAMVGSLVFFLPELYGEEIRGAWPFYWGPFSGFSRAAALFWLGVATVAGLLMLKNKADDDARLELVRATDRITELVQTLPPRGWREDYAAAVNAAAEGLQAVVPRVRHPEVNRAHLAELIRELLGSIATLAYRFDAQPRTAEGPVEYAANVMTFVERSGKGTPEDPFFADHVRAAVKFLPADFSLESLAGVLYLQPDLAYSTRTGGRDPLPPLALPIPITPRSASGGWRVLPGAPLAFVSKAVDGYADVGTIGAWFDEFGDFPRSVRDEVLGHFSGPGSAVRSFLSLPLIVDEEKVGVLSIHAARPNLLGVLDAGTQTPAAAARRDDFLALMTPLLRELENAVELFRTAPPPGL
jgi:hypothetical protein